MEEKEKIDVVGLIRFINSIKTGVKDGEEEITFHVTGFIFSRIEMKDKLVCIYVWIHPEVIDLFIENVEAFGFEVLAVTPRKRTHEVLLLRKENKKDE